MFSQGKIGSLDHPMMDLNEGPVHCCGGVGVVFWSKTNGGKGCAYICTQYINTPNI